MDLLLKMKNQRIKKTFIGIKKTYSFRGRRSTFARSGTNFVARAALSQGRRNAFAGFAAGAALSQGAVQISWQSQYFRKVRYRFRSRRGTFARSGTDSRQVQYFRKVRFRFCGRRSTFARGANFAAGAALSQGTVQSLTQAQHSISGGVGGAAAHDVRGSEDSTRGALSSVSILQISRGVGGAAAPSMMFEEVMIQQRVVMIAEVMIQQRVR